MYEGFFFRLRQAGIPVSLREFLTLMDGLALGVADHDVTHFYHLARTCLVKDERHLDRFDRAFSEWFEGLSDPGDPMRKIPEEWLRSLGRRFLDEDEWRALQTAGSWEKLMETLRERLAEQQERHAGGSRWIGTGGTSPFGADGAHPEGVRIGQSSSHHRRAVKVWDERHFADFDDQVELGTRQMKIALRKLRRLTRDGAPAEFDLDATVRSTAHNAGWLDVKLRPARGNAMKVLLMLDVGGSMDDHVSLVEQLFSAARSEFKHLEAVYFHNCLYERVWTSNRRRDAGTVPTLQLLARLPRDTRLVLVGDASMSPYEIVARGASVEHWNDEPGAVWMERALSHWERAVWINPVPRAWWDDVRSIGMLRDLMGGRMVPLTLAGIDEAVALLKA